MADVIDSTSATSDGSLTVAAPSAPTGAPLVAVHIADSDGTLADMAAVGWREDLTHDTTSGEPHVKVYSRQHDGSASYDFAGSDGQASTVVIVFALSDADYADLYSVAPVLNITGQAAAQVANSITTPEADTLLVDAWGSQLYTAAADNSYSYPASMTPVATATTDYVYGGVAVEQRPAAGATGTRTATSNASPQTSGIAVAFAIRTPAPAGDTFTGTGTAGLALDATGTGTAVYPPTVDAGADVAALPVGDTFTRTAGETGAGITGREWTIESGPVGAGTTIGTAAALSWLPGSSTIDGDIRQPTYQETAFELTSTCENSTSDWTGVYGYIEDIGDGRGYTGGIVGFTSATGDMLALVQHYTDLEPGNALAGWLDELQTLTTEGEGANAGARADALLGASFRTAWAAAAANDPIFREAQRDERRASYWQPALDQALADEVGPLGLAILYDVSVNHGPGEDPESFGGIVATAQANAAPPSQGGDETAYLSALVDAREQVLIGWGDNQPDGRVSMHRGLISSGNLALTTPFSWSVYGDTFTASTPPDPPVDSTVGTYVLRYTATNAGGSGSDDVQVTVVELANVTGAGHAGHTLDATGTGTSTRGGTGTPGAVALDTTGTGTSTRTATGTPGAVALDQAAGAGTKTATGTGTAGLTLDQAAGLSSRAATGSTTSALTLDATGAGRAARFGTAVEALDVTAGGTGRPVRAGTSTAGLTLDDTGTGTRTAAGAGAAAAALDDMSTGVRATDGAAALHVALSASSTGTRDTTGTGTTGLDLDASGAGSLTYTGTAALDLATAGTGERATDGAGAGGLTVDPSGTGTAARAGAGTAGLTLAGAGAGEDVHRGRGVAAVDLATAGTGTRFSSGAATSGATLDAASSGTSVRTGAGAAGLTLDVAGYGTERTGTGSTGLALDAVGGGQRVATGDGMTGLDVAITSTASVERTGSSTAGLTLDEQAVGERTGHGAGTAALDVDTAGAGNVIRTGTGTARLDVDTSTAGERAGRGHGATAITLDVTGAAAAVTRTAGGRTGLALAATGSAHPVARGTGRTGLVLGARPRRRHPGRLVATGAQSGLAGSVTSTRLEASA